MAQEEGKGEAGQSEAQLQDQILRDYECTSMMDEFLEILKLLNYEQRFCKQKGFKPFTRTYFCYPVPNSGEQFLYFNYIAVWLLSLNGVQISGWSKFEDPAAVCNNIVLELTKLGITFDFPPTKLKSGAGEAVCMLLVKLAQRALKHTRFAFGNPAVAPEDSKENDEAGDIEGGDEGVEEELENKEMVDEEIGDVERPKQGGNVEDDEEEYFVVNPQQ